MAKVTNKLKEFQSKELRNKIGSPQCYGEILFSESQFGDERKPAAIYQKRHCKDGIFIIKEKYYITDDPKTPAQLAQRDKVRQANTAWHNLTTEQKMIYHERAKKLPLTGYNLFIREQLLSS